MSISKLTEPGNYLVHCGSFSLNSQDRTKELKLTFTGNDESKIYLPDETQGAEDDTFLIINENLDGNLRTEWAAITGNDNGFPLSLGIYNSKYNGRNLTEIDTDYLRNLYEIFYLKAYSIYPNGGFTDLDYIDSKNYERVGYDDNLVFAKCRASGKYTVEAILVCEGVSDTSTLCLDVRDLQAPQTSAGMTSYYILKNSIGSMRNISIVFDEVDLKAGRQYAIFAKLIGGARGVLITHAYIKLVRQI